MVARRRDVLLQRNVSAGPVVRCLSGGDADVDVRGRRLYRTLHVVRTRGIFRKGSLLPVIFVHLPDPKTIPEDTDMAIIRFIAASVCYDL